MAWGSSVNKAPPPPRSALSKTLPLLLLFILLAGVAFVAYHLYLASLSISSAAAEKIQSKNVVFTKDGMKVGVREMKNENYVDKTQSFLVKAWNLSDLPSYKSKLWNKQQEESAKTPRMEQDRKSLSVPEQEAGHRKSFSRKSSTT